MIKRYEIYGTHRGEKEVEEADGTYVLYDDHQRIVKELEDQIEYLKQQCAGEDW